jgi:hypothetical protein
MAGYTAFADLEVGSSVRGKINTQFSEIFSENTKATITVADEAARLAIPAEYLSEGKIVYQLDVDADYIYKSGLWEVHVPQGGQFYGEMYLYQNATVTAIDIVNAYHPLAVATAIGMCNGFTPKLGKVSAVASVASAAGGAKITCTSVAHGFLDGEVIAIVNSTNYDGNYYVESKTNDTFVVAKAYVATRAFNAIRGGSLKAGANSAGVYELSWNASAKPSAVNKNFTVEPFVNLTPEDKASCNQLLSSTSDTQNVGSGCILTIAAGDYIFMGIKNTTDSTDLTVVSANLRIKRI